MNRVLCAVLLLATAVTAPVQARNLSEMVADQIELKDAELRAKAAGPAGAMQAGAMPPGAPGGPAPAAAVAPAAQAQDGASRKIDAEDIQLIGVYGVGANLKALVCVKTVCSRDSAHTLVQGQHLGGWVLARLTPDQVVFERPHKKGKKPETREIYLSAPVTAQLANNGTGASGGTYMAPPTSGQAPLILPTRQPMQTH